MTVTLRSVKGSALTHGELDGNFTDLDTNKTPTTRQVATQHSLTGGGDLSANRTISLVNDAAAPVGARYYGTDAGGVKGYHVLGSGTPNAFDDSVAFSAGRTGEVLRSLDARIDDIVDLRDFGLVRNNFSGSVPADNTPKFNAAIAEAKADEVALYVPVGTWYVDGPLDLRDIRRIVCHGSIGSQVIAGQSAIWVGSSSTTAGTATDGYYLELRTHGVVGRSGTVGIEVAHMTGGFLDIVDAQGYGTALKFTGTGWFMSNTVRLGNIKHCGIAIHVAAVSSSVVYENDFFGGDCNKGSGPTSAGNNIGLLVDDKFQSNSFYGTNFEGFTDGIMKLVTNAQRNQFHDLRGELSGAPVFAGLSGGNTVRMKYRSNAPSGSNQGMPAYVTTSFRPNFVWWANAGPTWRLLARVDYRDFVLSGTWSAPNLQVYSTTAGSATSTLSSGDIVIDSANESFQLVSATKAIGFIVNIGRGEVIRPLVTMHDNGVNGDVNLVALDSTGVKIPNTGLTYALIQGELEAPLSTSGIADYPRIQYDGSDFKRHDHAHQAADSVAKKALILVGTGTYREIAVWGMVDFRSRPLPL